MHCTLLHRDDGEMLCAVGCCMLSGILVPFVQINNTFGNSPLIPGPEGPVHQKDL